MKSRTLAWITLLGLFLGMPMSFAGEEWLTDLARAKELAKEKNVPILINFSGSDWCGWCIRLDREVLSRSEFKEYAKEHLALLMVDFPQFKNVPDSIAEQNRKLAETYGVQGFPTLLLVDADGKVLARTGYRPGGAEAYVEHLKSLIRGRET